MAISAINTANIFKRNIFKNNDIQKCPCGEKKAAPLKELLNDKFEVSKSIFK